MLSFPPKYEEVVELCKDTKFEAIGTYVLMYHIALVECGVRPCYFHDYYAELNELVLEYSRIWAPRLTWWRDDKYGIMWLSSAAVKAKSVAIGTRLGFLTPLPDDLPKDDRMIMALSLSISSPDTYIGDQPGHVAISDEYVDFEMLGGPGPLRAYITNMITRARENLGDDLPIELSLFWMRNNPTSGPSLRPLPYELSTLWNDLKLLQPYDAQSYLQWMIDDPKPDVETIEKLRTYADIYNKKIANGTLQ